MRLSIRWANLVTNSKFLTRMKNHTCSASLLGRNPKGVCFILSSKLQQGSGRPSSQSRLLPDTDFPSRGHWVAPPPFFPTGQSKHAVCPHGILQQSHSLLPTASGLCALHIIRDSELFSSAKS